MTTILKFDINYLSIFLLILLFFTIKLRKSSGTSNQLFFRLLWVTVFLLILEVLSWTFDRVQGKNIVNYALNMAFAWFTSLATCILASYLDYHMFGSYNRLRKRWFYIQPFMLTGVLLIINLFVPIIFSVDANNVYQREPLMVLLPIINFAAFLFICYLAIKNRNKIQKELIFVMLLYVLMPALAAFLQVALFGIFILWPLMAVTVSITYIFLETVSTSRDYLTGLLSRHRIDAYLDYMLVHKKSFVLVMLDLDKFKSINDIYGHINGDNALKVFSKALFKQFGKDKAVGRYAGDEFILILEKMNIEEIMYHLEKVQSQMCKLHNNGKIDFLITFSYGYYEHTANDNISYNDIIHTVDQRMYSNKKLPV